VIAVFAGGDHRRLGNEQITMKTDQLNQETTTSIFLNPSLGLLENKSLFILADAFLVLQSPLLKTDPPT
jgi:hypothetical protein